MGQHVYFLEVMKQSKSFPKPGDLFFDSLNQQIFSDTSNFSSSIGNRHYLDTKSCREFVVSCLMSVRTYISFRPVGENFLTGIRCFGAQHTSVAKVLLSSEKDYARVFENFFKKLLGINVTIDAGRVPEKSHYRTFPIGTGTRVSLGNTTIDNDGYITIYLRSWKNRGEKNLPTKASAIMWILREPLICEYILQGKITDNVSLAKCVLELAAKRTTGDDESYMPLAIYANSNYSMSQAIKSCREEQSSAYNGNGFDYLSTMWMSLYFMGMGDRCFKYPRHYLHEDGPISLMRDYLLNNHMEKYMKILSEQLEHLLAVMKKINSRGSNNNSRDRDLLRTGGRYLVEKTQQIP